MSYLECMATMLAMPMIAKKLLDDEFNISINLKLKLKISKNILFCDDLIVSTFLNNSCFIAKAL